MTFWFAKDLLFAVLGMFDVLPGGGGVAFGAHVGGFAAGLASVAIFQWRKRRREARPEPEGLVIEPAAALAAARRVQLRAEAPTRGTGETPTIFLHDGQQQTGPFTLSSVQAMLERGEINADASYWSEGMADWQSVTDLASQPM